MVPHLIPGVEVESFGTALAAAAILGVLNLIVRPLIVILTLPLTLVTLGFFLLVINALMFQFAGYLVSGFHVHSFFSAFFASILVSLVTWIFGIPKPSGGKFNWTFIRREPPPSSERSRPTVSGDTIDLEKNDKDKWV